MKKLLLPVLLLSLITKTSSAQAVEMADEMRASGKIYVVVGVLAIIIAGFFVYLFLVDRKISRIEREIRK